MDDVSVLAMAKTVGSNVIATGPNAALAIPMGLLVGRHRGVREYLEPVIRLLYPIPGIAWIPLAILWFGLTDKAVVFVVFIAEFFALFFNTEAGARAINPLLIDGIGPFPKMGIAASGAELERKDRLQGVVPKRLVERSDDRQRFPVDILRLRRLISVHDPLRRACRR